MHVQAVPAPTARRSVDPALLQALRKALAGGRPLAPLPPEPREAEQVLTMLRPDEPVTEPDAAVIVATSGSTGRPKGVVLSRPALAASADATHERLGGPGDWLLALPLHYVAGLMMLVRAEIAGTHARPVGSDLSGLDAALDVGAGRRYLSIVPTQLVRALSDPRLIGSLSRLDAVLLGGAAADPALLERGRAAGIPLVTTYGMSETCGGCVYDGVPLAGVSISLDDSQRITIAGQSVFSGYRLRPELSAEALQQAPDGERRFRTQDRGAWRTAPADTASDTASDHPDRGRLEVLGRLDDVVISGGLNVDLAEVERAVQAAVARTGPAGGDWVVVAVPDAEWGSRIVAVTDDRQFTRDGGLDRLRSRLRGRLADHALPRDVITLAALPRLSSGKIDRMSLIADLSADAPPDRLSTVAR